MHRLNKNRTRQLFIPGAFFFLALLTISVYSMEAQILLAPPGLRPVKDPSLVIPADYRYPNELIKLPAYRDASGNPADGWSGRFVDTRRFVSNQSAWIYLRDSDLQQSVSMKRDAAGRSFRFWPVGTTMVIESYRGDAFHKKREALIDIDVISKVKGDDESSAQAFYPVNWTYARFNPDGRASITSAKVQECHQCHSIAFHLTGDLIFTQFY